MPFPVTCLNRTPYLSAMWLGVAPRMDTKHILYVYVEKIGLSAQILITIFGLVSKHNWRGCI